MIGRSPRGIGARDDMDGAVIVALGCNDKGQWHDCAAVLEAALDRFDAEGMQVQSCSSYWTSLAWPDPSDPSFVNAVAIVDTKLVPCALLSVLNRIEARFGRARGQRNAPRTLDLDLIAYGRTVGEERGLILPHPRAAERRFVMGPLAEIAPGWRHPQSGQTARQLAQGARVGLDASPMRGL